MKKTFLILACLPLVFAACGDSNDSTDTPSRDLVPDHDADINPNNFAPFNVAFYNVENLFDTLDLAETADDEFTPESEKHWNTERYNMKLDHVSEVLSKINGKAGTYPDLIGLCEVENRTVVEDLMAHGNFGGTSFGIVHAESPDGRGIDAALVYQTDRFEVLTENFYEILVPDAERPNTRLLLYVKGKVNATGEELHVFVNHWPSRHGGQEASEPKRLTVATKARAIIDSIQNAQSDAKIILVGDFNDYPNNKSVKDVLRASTSPSGAGDLYNLSGDLVAEGVGTYNYKGDWGILDQAIVSQALKNANSGLQCSPAGCQIYREDYILYHDQKYDDWKPSRTYGGPNYYGGYSDHLPILVRLSVPKE